MAITLLGATPTEPTGTADEEATDRTKPTNRATNSSREHIKASPGSRLGNSPADRHSSQGTSNPNHNVVRRTLDRKGGTGTKN